MLNAFPLHKKWDCAHCRTKGACLRGNLAADDARLLDQCMRHSNPLKKHQRLFCQGDRLQSIYIVQSGLLSSYLIDYNGEEKIVDFHFPGDMLGFDAIETQTHTSTAIAIQDSSICKLSWHDFKRLSDACSHFQMQVLMNVSGELAENHEMMKVLSQKQAGQKLAYFLLSISHKMKLQGFSSTEYNLGMTRDEIANFLATAPETISREFTELRKQGIIEVQRKRIRIHDLERLRSIASLKT